VTRPDPRERRAIPVRKRQQERLIRTVVAGCTLLGIGGIALVASARDEQPANAGALAAAPAEDAARAADPAAAAPDAAAVTSEAAGVTSEAAEGADAAGPAPDSLPDLAIADEPTELTDDCIVAPESMSYETKGVDVQCLQQALSREGFYSGEIDGMYDYDVAAAVEKFQTEHELFVDGVAGRETGKALDIWPDEQMLVERTPPLPQGTMDSWGFPVSSVTALGDGIPPLPEDSGSGYRVVYERISQRVWAVDENETVLRSWLVSGSQYENEVPGTHRVYSRSEWSTAWNGKAKLPYMIRWYRTEIGHIGFHGIPTKVSDGSAYQTEDELGTRLSGGCQRQSNPDAAFLWAFAKEGTKVVVL